MWKHRLGMDGVFRCHCGGMGVCWGLSWWECGLKMVEVMVENRY
jgi:hypothetical protein